MCAAWGSTAQRKGNLDALASHVQRYIAESEARRDPVTVVGALRYLEELANDWGWQNHREDSQALLRGEEAVTISTWHRAKGLEWRTVRPSLALLASASQGSSHFPWISPEVS